MMSLARIYQWYRRWRSNEQDKCTVTINEPKMRIRGKLVQGLTGYPYFGFFGVPYALPPIGRLRFAPPQPLTQTWYFRRPPLYRAYTEPDHCLQKSPLESVWNGSEDCLYLNVFIPKKPEDNLELLPVIVFIPGSSFERGSCNAVDPSIIVPMEKCILVTLNFRLNCLGTGVFYGGFLNMRSDNCCGNAGLKDQVMALKWIRDNIEPFGGDPHKVTIYGNNSGGTSVNLHMISPLSKGLFHKAIISGGCISCPWGCGDHTNEPKELFKRNKCILDNELRHVLVESFKSVLVNDFLKLSSRITNHVIKIEPKAMKVYLKPSVEYTHDDAFLPDTPENLKLVAEPVPTMAGIAKQEGYIFYRSMPSIDPVLLVRNEEMLIMFVQAYFGWCDESVRRFLPKLRARYFPHHTNMSDADIRENFATLVTDACFLHFYNDFKIGNLCKPERPPLYIYEFDYFCGEPIVPSPQGKNGDYTVEIKAAEHGDDMMYVLGARNVACTLQRISDPEKRQKTLEQIVVVMINMCVLWASFCRDGVPVCLNKYVEWRQHTEEDPCYLHIGETLSLCPGRLNERRWKELNIIGQLNKALMRPS